jgi:hypothetical protein
MPELHFWEVAYLRLADNKNDGVVPDAPFMVIEPNVFSQCVRCILQDDIDESRCCTGPVFARILDDIDTHYGYFDSFAILDQLNKFAIKTSGQYLGGMTLDAVNFDYINKLNCKASDLFYYVETMRELIKFNIQGHGEYCIRHNTYELPDVHDEVREVTIDSGA